MAWPHACARVHTCAVQGVFLVSHYLTACVFTRLHLGLIRWRGSHLSRKNENVTLGCSLQEPQEVMESTCGWLRLRGTHHANASVTSAHENPMYNCAQIQCVCVCTYTFVIIFLSKWMPNNSFIISLNLYSHWGYINMSLRTSGWQHWERSFLFCFYWGKKKCQEPPFSSFLSSKEWMDKGLKVFTLTIESLPSLREFTSLVP